MSHRRGGGVWKWVSKVFYLKLILKRFTRPPIYIFRGNFVNSLHLKILWSILVEGWRGFRKVCEREQWGIGSVEQELIEMFLHIEFISVLITHIWCIRCVLKPKTKKFVRRFFHIWEGSLRIIHYFNLYFAYFYLKLCGFLSTSLRFEYEVKAVKLGDSDRSVLKK